jgi:hypothetical protein
MPYSTSARSSYLRLYYRSITALLTLYRGSIKGLFVFLIINNKKNSKTRARRWYGSGQKTH